MLNHWTERSTKPVGNRQMKREIEAEDVTVSF